jgi:hypothetical protein
LASARISFVVTKVLSLIIQLNLEKFSLIPTCSQRSRDTPEFRDPAKDPNGFYLIVVVDVFVSLLSSFKPPYIEAQADSSRIEARAPITVKARVMFCLYGFAATSAALTRDVAA